MEIISHCHGVPFLLIFSSRACRRPGKAAITMTTATLQQPRFCVQSQRHMHTARTQRSILQYCLRNQTGVPMRHSQPGRNVF